MAAYRVRRVESYRFVGVFRRAAVGFDFFVAVFARAGAAFFFVAAAMSAPLLSACKSGDADGITLDSWDQAGVR